LFVEKWLFVVRGSWLSCLFVFWHDFYVRRKVEKAQQKRNVEPFVA
jgi:hypothetical protein